jgi:hypothetical protein
MPTHAEADRAMCPRAVGARIAAGPFQALPKSRWGVPAVAYMSLDPIGEVVLALEGKRWVAVERRAGEGARAEEMR